MYVDTYKDTQFIDYSVAPSSCGKNNTQKSLGLYLIMKLDFLVEKNTIINKNNNSYNHICSLLLKLRDT